DARTIPGISSGQGPYLYSYCLNVGVGYNTKPYPGGPRTKITQWLSPWRKIMLAESHENYGRVYRSPAWSEDDPLARRHGTYRLRGNVPGFPEMTPGVVVGRNASAAFIDGHAESIDTDFTIDPTQRVPSAR